MVHLFIQVLAGNVSKVPWRSLVKPEKVEFFVVRAFLSQNVEAARARSWQMGRPCGLPLQPSQPIPASLYKLEPGRNF